MAKLTAKQERDIVDNFLHKLGAKAKILRDKCEGLSLTHIDLLTQIQ